MRIAGGGGLVLAMLLLAGCADTASDIGTACTAVGSGQGLGITIAPDVAPVRNLRLRLCQDGRCRTHRVSLSPGTAVGAEDCSGSGPDASCSAELTANGTQFGFVESELSVGTVETGGQYQRAGRTTDIAVTDVEVATVYPNGPDCGAGGTQAHVTLHADGLR